MRITAPTRRLASVAVAAILIAGVLQTVGLTGASAAPVFDIRDFGAVANDGSDDSAAIQSAIDAAGGGGKVFIPGGVFVVSPQRTDAALVLRSGVTIEGVGPASVLRVADGNGQKVRVISSRSGDPQAPRNVVLRNFTIDGNRGTSGQAASHEQDHGLFISGTTGNLPSDVLIEGLSVTGMQGDGIFVHAGERITIRYNRVFNNYRAGLNLEGAGHSLAIGNVVSENKSGVHVEINPGVVNRGLVITGNTLTNNNCGVCLNGGDGVLEGISVTGNLLDDQVRDRALQSGRRRRVRQRASGVERAGGHQSPLGGAQCRHRAQHRPRHPRHRGQPPGNDPGGGIHQFHPQQQHHRAGQSVARDPRRPVCHDQCRQPVFQHHLRSQRCGWLAGGAGHPGA